MLPTHTFLTETSQISPEWLEKILRPREGNSRVTIRRTEIVKELYPAYSRAACLLKVVYDANPGGLPEAFFFKIGHRPAEAEFFQKFAPRTNSPALVTCYHAECADELGMCNLLFEDLSASHTSLPDESHIEKFHLLNMAEILAGIHRQWWDHDDLRPGQPGIDDLPGFIWNNTREKLASFFKDSGDALTAEDRRLYERIFAASPLPAWSGRIHQHRWVTLSHGDPHFWNFLWPVRENLSPRIVDWGLWHVNLPAYDVAYFLALHTIPDQRRQMEKEILQHYLDTLSIYGYGWDELVADYRLSIYQQTIWPVFFHDFTPREGWLALVKNILSAFTDWNCEELLA
jgi:thiamine kinase-like enzyme